MEDFKEEKFVVKVKQIKTALFGSPEFEEENTQYSHLHRDPELVLVSVLPQEQTVESRYVVMVTEVP